MVITFLPPSVNCTSANNPSFQKCRRCQLVTIQQSKFGQNKEQSRPDMIFKTEEQIWILMRSNIAWTTKSMSLLNTKS